MSPRLPGLSAGQMTVCLLFVVAAFAAALMPAQNDTFWHLRDGLEIWRTGKPPSVDTYSHSARGLPYLHHYLLAQLSMYGLYRLGGMPALQIGASISVLLTLFLTYRLMTGPPLTRSVVLALAIALSASAWSLRPQLATFFYLMLLLFLLARERFLVVPLVFFLWANTHGGVIAGAIILGVATGTAALLWAMRRTPDNQKRLLTLALILPASLIAMLATPLGFNLFSMVVKTETRGHALGIQEWGPTLPVDFFGVIFWLTAVVFLLMLVTRRRRLFDVSSSTSWADWLMVASALVLLPLAVRSLRHVALFALVAAPAMSRLLGSHFEFQFKSDPARRGSRYRLNLLIVCLAAAAAVLAAPMVWLRSRDMLNWQPLSEPAQQAVRSCPGPIYNVYEDGGYLIWFVPDVPVFVDSRQDPYPLSFLLEQLRVEKGQAPWQPLFARWSIQCAFLPRTSPMVAALVSAQWPIRYRDRRWIMLERPGGAG